MWTGQDSTVPREGNWIRTSENKHGEGAYIDCHLLPSLSGNTTDLVLRNEKDIDNPCSPMFPSFAAFIHPMYHLGSPHSNILRDHLLCSLSLPPSCLATATAACLRVSLLSPFIATPFAVCPGSPAALFPHSHHCVRPCPQISFPDFIKTNGKDLEEVQPFMATSTREKNWRCKRLLKQSLMLSIWSLQRPLFLYCQLLLIQVLKKFHLF